MRFRVHRIFVLVRIIRIRNFARQFLRHGIITTRIVRFHRRRTNNHLRPKRFQQIDFLARLFIINREHYFVSAHASHQRQPHARISRSALDDCPARLQFPRAFRFVDHRQADAVLHRPARIHVISLDVNFGGQVFSDAIQPDQRRVAHRFQNILALHVRSFPSQETNLKLSGFRNLCPAASRRRSKPVSNWCLSGTERA